MNYELSVKGKRVSGLSKARSLVDYHRLRQKHAKSICISKEMFQFEYLLDECPKSQKESIRSRRTISSSHSRRAEIQVTNSPALLLDVLAQKSDSRKNMVRQTKTLNFPFNLNHTLSQFRSRQRPKTATAFPEYVAQQSDNAFKNRVYKIRRNGAQRSFYLDCLRTNNQ